VSKIYIKLCKKDTYQLYQQSQFLENAFKQFHIGWLKTNIKFQGIAHNTKLYMYKISKHKCNILTLN